MPSPFMANHKTSRLWPYVQIARVEHWFKNVFMLLGVGFALFYAPALATWSMVWRLVLGVVATCLIASSNYVINEILDAPRDRFHPVKKYRPVPSGKVRRQLAIAEWLLLGMLGIGLASALNRSFLLSGITLWIMGVFYNVPPIRTKEVPYLDVLSESVNNPLRLLLGWFVLIETKLPPLSLILAYWMAGAFFMATKRFAEYRRIGDRDIAMRYRQSFAYYTEDRLLVSMFFYVTMSAFFAGIFIVRYHLELILFVPIAAGFLAYYLQLGLQHDSPVQHPEKLFQERGFLVYATMSTVIFVVLMFVHIPLLYRLFSVEPVRLDPLWTLGSNMQQQLRKASDCLLVVRLIASR